MKASFVLATLALFAGAQAHGLKQALARDVAAHERFADLAARQPTPSGAGATCPDGTPCQSPCCSDCAIHRKRDNSARDLWILEEDFLGEVYSAKVIAELIKGDGVFVHHNGSTIIDFDYKMNAEANRVTLWKNKRAGSGLLEKVKRGFIKFSAPYLAKTIAVYFENPDKVFMLSESSGVKNKDIIRMAKALLEDKERDEFLIWHHAIDRETMSTVVDTLCPRLGPQYCEN